VSVLKKLEEKIQNLFEGSFSRTFKSPVQPVELARKLVKEMEDHKVVSVSRIYAPNEYRLFLSPSDMDQFAAYEEQLKADLADYLIEHARKEKYDVLSRPIIILESDEDLNVGEFGIATRMVSAPVDQSAAGGGAAVAAPPPAFSPEVSQTVVYRPLPSADGTMSVSAEEARRMGLAHDKVTLTMGDRVFEINRRVTLLGRSRQCDVVVPDSNVSRRHAEIRQQGDDFVLVDLGSTNGVEVNGKRVETMTLKNGDVLTMGTTRVRFERQI